MNKPDPRNERPSVYRVQAADGRGPWRPGFSRRWIEDESEERLRRFPSVVDAFGFEWVHEIPSGWRAGCACRSLDALMAWFTPLEQRRLEALGYSPVSLVAEKIIRESDVQLIFARRLPLKQGALVLPWRIAA